MSYYNCLLLSALHVIAGLSFVVTSFYKQIILLKLTFSPKEEVPAKIEENKYLTPLRKERNILFLEME